MTDVVCSIAHLNFKGTYVHYDVTTFCDVCETANRLRLLSFTWTSRSGDVNECMYVVVDSEYHHQWMGIFDGLYQSLLNRVWFEGFEMKFRAFRSIK